MEQNGARWAHRGIDQPHLGSPTCSWTKWSSNLMNIGKHKPASYTIGSRLIHFEWMRWDVTWIKGPTSTMQKNTIWKTYLAKTMYMPLIIYTWKLDELESKGGGGSPSGRWPSSVASRAPLTFPTSNLHQECTQAMHWSSRSIRGLVDLP